MTIVTAGDKAYILDSGAMLGISFERVAAQIKETLFQKGFQSVTFASISFDDELNKDFLLKNKRGDCVVQAEGLMAKLTNKFIGEKTGYEEITDTRQDTFNKNPIRATQDAMAELLMKSAKQIYEYNSGVETPKKHECENENVVLEPLEYIKWHDRTLMKDGQYTLDSGSNILSIGNLEGEKGMLKTTIVSKKDLTIEDRIEPKYFQKLLDDGKIKGVGQGNGQGNRNGGERNNNIIF